MSDKHWHASIFVQSLAEISLLLGRMKDNRDDPALFVFAIVDASDPIGQYFANQLSPSHDPSAMRLITAVPTSEAVAALRVMQAAEVADDLARLPRPPATFRVLTIGRGVALSTDVPLDQVPRSGGAA